MSETPKTDAIRITIAAGDWRKESDCTEAALNHAANMEKQLISAKKSEQDCRQIITTYCEEIDGLNKLIAQKDGELRALREVVEKHLPCCHEPDEYSNDCVKHCSACALLKEISTPSPSAVVPKTISMDTAQKLADCLKFAHFTTDLEGKRKEALAQFEAEKGGV